MVSCTDTKLPICRSSALRLALWLKYRSLASLDSIGLYLAALISSRHRFSCLPLSASCDTVLSVPLVHLVVFCVMFPSSIRSTAACPNIMQMGEYAVVHHTVILSAQSTASRWPMHLTFGWSEQAVGRDRASPIDLYLSSIIPSVAAWSGLLWCSGYCSNWGGGGQWKTCSMLLRPVPYSPGFRPDNFFLCTRQLLPSLMYPVFVVMPLSIRWDICRQPHVCDTPHSYWACTEYSFLFAAIGTCLWGVSGVYHSVEVLSSHSFRRDSHCLGHQHTFPATSTSPVPFRMIFLFHSARSVCVQHPLCWSSSLCSQTALPAVQLFSASSRALYLEQGIFLLPTNIGISPSEIFLPAP